MRTFHIDGRGAVQAQISEALTALRALEGTEGVYAYVALDRAAMGETQRLAAYLDLNDQLSFEAPPAWEVGLERIALATGDQLPAAADTR